jgi:hypothetical protein
VLWFGLVRFGYGSVSFQMIGFIADFVIFFFAFSFSMYLVAHEQLFVGLGTCVFSQQTKFAGTSLAVILSCLKRSSALKLYSLSNRKMNGPRISILILNLNNIISDRENS